MILVVTMSHTDARSQLLLNHAEQPRQWCIHPWLHSNCNSLSDADQLRQACPDPRSNQYTEHFIQLRQMCRCGCQIRAQCRTRPARA